MRLVREIVERHDFAAHEAFEREGGQHVQAEAKSGNIDHQVVVRKVVEDVALGFVAE